MSANAARPEKPIFCAAIKGQLSKVRPAAFDSFQTKSFLSFPLQDFFDVEIDFDYYYYLFFFFFPSFVLHGSHGLEGVRGMSVCHLLCL